MNEDSIRTDVYLVLHDLLKNNLSEVNNRVYSSYPTTKIKLPLVIIEPAIVETTNFLTTRGYTVTVPISVYTKKASDIDLLSDKITKIIRDNSQILWDNKMYLLSFFDNDSSNFVDLNNNKGHYKMLSFVFRVIK